MIFHYRLLAVMDFLSGIVSSAMVSFFLVLICFCVLLLKTFMGKSLNHPQYPPVMGTVFHELLYFNCLYDYHTDLARKHRTFRLLAPSNNELFTTDPRNVEHILKTNFDKYSKGSHDHEILEDLLGHGIFNVDGDKWRQQRKIASFEFSTRVLRDFSCSVFRRKAAKLAETIMGFGAMNQTFDIQDLLMRFSLESIFKVGFGVDLNCLGGSSEEGRAFIKAFDDSNQLVFFRYVNPFWKLKRILRLGSEGVLKKNIKFMDDFVLGVISHKRKQMLEKQNYNDKEDILSRFLVESKKDPQRMTDQYLKDIILNFMVAGKDTSAGTLSWFFYLLCKHPLIQEKVAEEVREIINCKENETNIDTFVECLTDAALVKMHYLHAALTETLRLYPVVPTDGRCAETDDVLPDGFRLKKGDGVNYMAYAMGRMNYIWGEDAEEFQPERWLNNGVFQPESPFKFVSFNGGPRNCLGKEFAYRQMKIVVMVLLRFFRFRLADEKKQVTYKTMITLHINGGLHLNAIPRIGFGKI
ncbi:cytochrome P450 704C1-like [Macadamia integrifolia]|uniref:cytochrome P450 704C1-like n=1 Tax=Macadamia integrifolia TaxID=60698 RepID=UPI001C4FA94E|nr:cytochrome P450 704C1-like [Macadamia integrifolia]